MNHDPSLFFRDVRVAALTVLKHSFYSGLVGDIAEHDRARLDAIRAIDRLYGMDGVHVLVNFLGAMWAETADGHGEHWRAEYIAGWEAEVKELHEGIVLAGLDPDEQDEEGS